MNVIANGPIRTPWAYVALFLVALVTLTLELLFTRLISVMAYYYLSFFIISVAILGMTVGALAVYLLPDRLAPGKSLGQVADAFFICIPLAALLVMAAPVSTSPSLTGAFTLVITALVTAVPFILSGILVSLSLTRCGLPYGKAYGADLAGAACGCFLSVPAANVLQPGSILLGLSGLAALAAYAYRRAGQGGPEVKPRPYILWLGVMAGLIFLTEATNGGLVLVSAKGKVIDPEYEQFQAWNSHSFVMVDKTKREQCFMWGASPKAPLIRVEQAALAIDAGAGTTFTHFDGNPESVRWLFNDVTMLAAQLQEPVDATDKPMDEVAIIGVGGGRDALAALVAKAKHVTAIDVNSLIIDLHTGRRHPSLAKFANLNGRPDLTFEHDDARSYLTRAPEKFDLITMSLVDTWAASSAGAYTLSENGLYTMEAWDTFLGRLSDRGMFTVSRWYSADGLDEASRTLSMAVASCYRQGLTPPQDHIVLASCDQIATLIVSRQPITGPLRERLKKICTERDFHLNVVPGEAPAIPLHREIVTARSEAQLAEICDRQPLNVAPATDDQPYFFNQLRPSSLVGLIRQPEFYGGASGNLKATTSLLTALFVALIGVGGGVFWPLSRWGLPKGLPVRIFGAGVAYFAAIGLGFMLIEMALVQRFSVLLGHPSYSLATVIGSMVLATGAGSVLSSFLPTDRPALFFIYPVVVLVVQLLAWLALPAVFAAAVTQSLPIRVAATLIFTVPTGLVMGVCFPLGMLQIARYGNEAAPWMWGINGAAGVLGTILAVLLSMTFGISATFLIGSLCYAVLLAANYWLREPATEKVVAAT